MYWPVLSCIGSDHWYKQYLWADILNIQWSFPFHTSQGTKACVIQCQNRYHASAAPFYTADISATSSKYRLISLMHWIQYTVVTRPVTRHEPSDLILFTSQLRPTSYYLALVAPACICYIKSPLPVIYTHDRVTTVSLMHRTNWLIAWASTLILTTSAATMPIVSLSRKCNILHTFPCTLRIEQSLNCS
jgi:hypothetical protein